MNTDGSGVEPLIDSKVGQTVDSLVPTRYARADEMDPFQCFVKRLVQLFRVRQNEVAVLSKLDVEVRMWESSGTVPETKLDLSRQGLTVAFWRSVPVDLWGSSAWTQAREMDQEDLALEVTTECYQSA